ncbi:unnamed protein product [Soboliphyme baturini]|uniref:AGC-kinase C-terminal domain-containing protein n=1 Tax=Soboliphyme baturini TaxID=241478 RepID=A0A183J237_9BILA|nr:unnamed protein product [Soboliphyme baturini]
MLPRLQLVEGDEQFLIADFSQSAPTTYAAPGDPDDVRADNSDGIYSMMSTPKIHSPLQFSNNPFKEFPFNYF